MLKTNIINKLKYTFKLRCEEIEVLQWHWHTYIGVELV